MNIILLGADYHGMMATSQRVYNLFSPLVQQHNISLLNICYSQPESVFDDGVTCVISPIVRTKPWTWYKGIQKVRNILCRRIQTNAQNIVYCYNYPFIDEWIILRVAKSLGYKIVFDITENIYTMHASSLARKMKLEIYRYLFCKVPQMGDVCFAISFSLVDLCRSVCKGKIPVYHLPISVDVEKIQGYREEKQNDKVVVFYGGSFGEKDGINILIDAFVNAHKQNPKLQLYLTGRIAKGQEENVNAWVKNANSKGECVRYFGCVPQDEYYRLVANADILCMPRVNSAFANAGFPFKLGEYLASGNAIITTRVSDVEQYLQHKVNAYFIEPEASQQMTQAMLILAGNNILRKQIGDAGYDIVIKYFEASIVTNFLYNNLKLIQ